MPTLKLTYFDFAGRAEIVRSTLRLGGVAFQDERLSFEQFAQRKASLPYGKLPVLEVDGHVVAENRGILRYAAQLAGVYPLPNDPVAALLVDEMIDTFKDFVQRLIAPSFHEKDPEKVKSMRLGLLSRDLPHALGIMDRRLTAIAAYPLFRNNPTKVFVHELLVWENVINFRSGALEHIPTTFIDNFETMIAIHDKVARVQGGTAVPDTIDVPKASPPTPEIFKLTFFDDEGCAERIRLAFKIGGIAFEDERISHEEFAERKASFHNGQLPVLKIGEDVIAAQSLALLRYVGRLTGLYPLGDPIRALKIDEVITHLDDLDDALVPLLAESDPEQKRVLGEKLLGETLPDLLGSLDKRLANWKLDSADRDTPFAVGSALSIADIAIHATLNLLTSGKLDFAPHSVVDSYTKLQQASNAVASHLQAPAPASGDM